MHVMEPHDVITQQPHVQNIISSSLVEVARGSSSSLFHLDHKLGWLLFWGEDTEVPWPFGDWAGC